MTKNERVVSLPKLSVVVPVYKVEAYLEKCVSSLLNQVFHDFEVILVDDGSPDNCGAICDELAKNDYRIRVIHKNNGGLSDARNVGIEAAKGDYIGFVDSDDWIAPEMYEKLLQVAGESKADIAVCGVYRVKDGKTSVLHSFEKGYIFEHDEAMRRILSNQIKSYACNKIYRRHLFNDLCYPVGRAYEDLATTYLLFAKAKRVACINYIGYYYLYRPASITTTANSYIKYQEFCSSQERELYASEHYPQIVSVCKIMTTKSAIGAYLQTLAQDGHISKNQEEQAVILKNYLRNIYYDKVMLKKIKNKQRLLLTIIFECLLVGKLYAKLSMWVKKRKLIKKGHVCFIL